MVARYGFAAFYWSEYSRVGAPGGADLLRGIGITAAFVTYDVLVYPKIKQKIEHKKAAGKLNKIAKEIGFTSYDAMLAADKSFIQGKMADIAEKLEKEDQELEPWRHLSSEEQAADYHGVILHLSYESHKMQIALCREVLNRK